MAAINAVILDTGPLVAYLDKTEEHHDWAEDALGSVTGRLITNDAVLSEALFLLNAFPQHCAAVHQMLRNGMFDLSFSLARESVAVANLMDSYRDVPMSLADACLVRLSELHPQCPVLTLGSDFGIYRRNKRDLIPHIAPLRP